MDFHIRTIVALISNIESVTSLQEPQALHGLPISIPTYCVDIVVHTCMYII